MRKWFLQRWEVLGYTRIRRVLLAYGLYCLVEYATWVAILLEAFAQGGPALAGVALIAMLVPAIVFVPILAGLGDRLPRGRALTLAHGFVGVCSLAIGALLAVAAPFWCVLVGGALLSAAVGVVRPLHFSALPSLVHRPGDLIAVNGISSSLDGITMVLGFTLGGAATGLVGPWAVLVLAGVVAGVCAWLSASLTLLARPQAASEEVGELREALLGFWTLRRMPGAILVLLLIALTAVVDGANDVLAVTYNDEVLGLGATTGGFLAGASGIGLAIGGAMHAGLVPARRVAPVLVLGALVLGVSEAVTPAFAGLLPAAVALTVMGIGMSMVQVSSRTLLQRTTDNAVLSRVLAVQETVMLAGLALGAVLAPLAIVALGPAAAFVPFGAAVCLMALFAYVPARGMERHAPSVASEITVLAEVPFLGLLPPDQLTRLAGAARRLSAPAGTVVIEQGQPGDAYYIVVSGELSVAVDGELLEHRLGPGDGFGEIALMRQVPRTATVTSLVESDLLAVTREEFLAAVMSTAAAAQGADAAAEGFMQSDRSRTRAPEDE